LLGVLPDPSSGLRAYGRTVAFTVPGSFIDATAPSGASVTAMVTAALLTVDAGIKMSFNDLGGANSGFMLGAAQPDLGEPEYTMGYRSALTPATAVVDVLSPDPRQQALQLVSGARLTGLNRENSMGKAPMAATATATDPAAPRAPAAAPATAASGDSWFSNALASVSGFFGSTTPHPSPPRRRATPASWRNRSTGCALSSACAAAA
jgi:hypothetical protein